MTIDEALVEIYRYYNAVMALGQHTFASKDKDGWAMWTWAPDVLRVPVPSLPDDFTQEAEERFPEFAGSFSMLLAAIADIGALAAEFESAPWEAEPGEASRIDAPLNALFKNANLCGPMQPHVRNPG